MRILRNSYLIILVFMLQACASVETEVPTDKLADAPDIMQLQGTVSNIREVKKDADFSERFGASFIGALVGGQIGGGSTKDIMGVTGAFIGADIADEKYGEVIDRLIIAGSDGKEYQALVHDHVFKVGDKVRFTLVSEHISAIVLDGGGNAE